MTELELLTIGRVSVDLYAEQLGVPFARVQSFAKSIGGSPTNVAVAAARLGRRSAVVTAVGADDFGGYAQEKLQGFGVDTRFVGTHPTLRTPLAFAAMDPPDEPTLLFYREPTAPDEHLELTDGLLDAARSVEIFWVAGSSLAGSQAGPTTRLRLRRRRRLRRRPVSRAALRVGRLRGGALCERGRGDRRLPAPLCRHHADERRGRGAPGRDKRRPDGEVEPACMRP
jgi:5-dehydro-2-deoxygluconokinase